MAPPAILSNGALATATATFTTDTLKVPSFQKVASAPSTSRMGNVVPFTVVEGPEAWTAADYTNQDSYIYHFSPADLAELEAAVAAALQQGRDLKDLAKEDFPLPTLGPKLVAFREEVRTGRGFQLFRGLPVWEYSREQTMAAYWAIGTYWGKAQSNNKKGHLIGHIKDIGYDPSQPTTRLYATHAAQPWHNDSSDQVALLCLSNAKEGGLSGWSSSIAVHNEIVRRRPDLARVLAGPWFMDRKGEVPEGKKGYFELPVFNYHQGYLSVNYSDNYYLLSQRFEEVPRLTPAHYEAMALFNELAASKELRLEMILQPGDIQLLNNHTCLHYRSAFVDYPEMDRKRHLLRLWVAPPVERPLPECYAELYGSTKVGDRGGIRVKGYDLKIPFEAE
ncbi:g8402 [Coccomyxa elongata]